VGLLTNKNFPGQIMRTHILILALVFLTTLLFGQSGDKVEQVRKAVEEINRASTTTKTLENGQFMEHMTDGGGKLTGYFKNGELVKVLEWVGLSSCVTNYEYYIRDGNLIFVYGQEKIFPYVDSTATFDYSTQTVSMECKFYFDNDKLIKSKFTGQPRCSNEPSDAHAPDLLDTSKRYLELLKK
jgi:hypothetical protein